VTDLNPYLDELVRHRASDLHLKVGAPAHLRLDGRLVPVPGPALTASDLDAITLSVVPVHRHDDLAERGEIDFALGVGGVGRFRVHVHRQRGSFGLVVRCVPPGVPSWEVLNLPQGVRRMADYASGLVIIGSPAGSGRTTTAAALIDQINQTRAGSIVTIEDPIEFLHPDKASLVTQREVGTDTPSFAEAMGRVTRVDADVVFLSDIPDTATAERVLAAATTGHLVVATLAAPTVAAAISRIIDFFPPQHQAVTRQLLGSSLRGVACQRLMERSDGRGRVPAVEVLAGTSRSAEVIGHPDNPRDSLERIMTEGQYHGMQSLDQALIALCRDASINVRDALAVSASPEDFRTALQSMGIFG
jgi:twitching motility protein PilT